MPLAFREHFHHPLLYKHNVNLREEELPGALQIQMTIFRAKCCYCEILSTISDKQVTGAKSVAGKVVEALVLEPERYGVPVEVIGVAGPGV